jgi:acetoacetyl-CoA synthetase
VTPPLLWEPDPAFVARTSMARCMRWLAADRGVEAADYHGLWRWSVDDVECFWASIWEHFDVMASSWRSGARPRRGKR